MSKILIIKTGATGDVVRTTVLLHQFLQDEVFWVTKRMNMEILPQKLPCLAHVLPIEDEQTKITLSQQTFDLVLSLDDDKQSIDLLNYLSTKQLIGAYSNKENKIVYTDNSADWFDLSLISRYSKQEADRKKYEGQKCVQQYLYQMIGKDFRGEEYLIREDIKVNKQEQLIGIEQRAGNRWPTKRWDKYNILADKLEKEGYNVFFFQQRENLKDYMEDIGKCSYVFTGDSLCMHIALALKIPTIAIFTCTSATEIYSYNRMQKVVSPFLWEAFFKTEYIAKAVENISLEQVYNAFTTLKEQTK